MIGIVLVSHSAELARSVETLAAQQTQGKVRMVAVGGTGDPAQPFGTDALAILEAIRSLDAEDGVLVLMDLGSAVLSAETALDLLEEGRRERVRLSHAPFVEGALAAAVQASAGAGLDEAAREAEAALAPKAESLAPAGVVFRASQADAAGVARPENASEGPGAGKEAVGRFRVSDPAGLHFGPAALLVQTAAAQPVAITLWNLTTGAGPADARRFNRVLELAAEHGHEIEVRAAGPGADAAVEAILKLAGDAFGAADRVGAGQGPAAARGSEAAGPAAGRGRRVLRGAPAAPGVAIGPAYLSDLAPEPELPDDNEHAADPQGEWGRYEAAAAQAAADLERLAAQLERETGAAEARVFRAHALILADPDFREAVRRAILEERLSASRAVRRVVEAEAQRYAALPVARLQARAADLHDLGARLRRLLAGAQPTGLRPPGGAVLVASDLSPSQAAALDPARVAALCLAGGGPDSHAAILARGRGIPAVSGLGAALSLIPAGAELAVDGAAGIVIVEPDAETAALYRGRVTPVAGIRRATGAEFAPAATRDGRRVWVTANLGSEAECAAARAAGAEGVGLLRTEFLFAGRREPPGEDEQYAAYRRIAEELAPRPVVIRTLDIGGDKPAPYLSLPAEANPFLGQRAIRISLAMPEFFGTQLRAILRAAAGGNIHVMFPMIATLAELAEARALLQAAGRALTARNTLYAAGLPLGAMVEVPAAVEMAGRLAQATDFLSIGTNDLAQYTFAADRGNARVAALADPLHPAVLRQVARVIEAAHAAGRPVALCGELAGRPEAIPILVGLGLDELSMAPASIPEARKLLARLMLPETQSLARHALSLPDGDAVRRAVDEAGYAR